MGYGCAISLKQTIQRLLDSCRISLDCATRKMLEFAYVEATSLQEFLKKLNHHHGGGNRLYILEVQILEAVNKLEDFLEAHQSDLFLHEDFVLIDSDRVKEEISCFAERAKKLREDYVEGSGEEDDDADASATESSSNTSFGKEMVGFSVELADMKNHATSVLRPEDFGVFSIVGDAGSGRSLVAKIILDEVQRCSERGFDYCVWVTVGSVYERETILQLILSQLLMSRGRPIDFPSCEETAEGVLWRKLAGRRYMIVLDDVCDTRILDYLLNLLPFQNNGSTVLVTTGSMRIVEHVRPYCLYMMYDVHNYGDIFWDIFRFTMFRRQPMLPEMEEAGRKIARNCRGLRLCMSKVLLYLLRADRTPQTWNEIANDQNHPLFRVVDELSEMQKIVEDFSTLTLDTATEKDVIAPFLTGIAITLDIKIIEKNLFPKRFFPKMEVISFFGMAGIGKTTFVKMIFDHVKNLDGFNPRPMSCVWVSLGPKYNSEDILIDIIAQIFSYISKKELKGDAELVNDLSRQLSNIRFLIVLDDVWSEAPLRNLAKLFPDIKGRALVTTRFAKVAQSEIIDNFRKMRFLSKEESWDLLCEKVFGEGGSCPHALEEAGKKIAENCDGLPLTILKVANLMSKDLSPQYWKDAANKSSDFTNALQELSKELLPCFHNLPLYLKSCFLYMGIFPQNYEVSTTKLLNLWISEGFFEPDLSQRVEDFAAQCLLELVNRSLVMICHKGSSSYGVKTCRLNTVLWHLSNGEALKRKFFHSIDSIQGMKNQRRICIRNCILLSNKDIQNSMMDSVATARSLVCTGLHHQYQLPVCFQLRLLRVLHALAIRFYEFPIEVVDLIHLRYLAITCDGKLPPSISKLWNLRSLIVGQHLRINSSSSYLPVEIWDMKELTHLQVIGNNLPTPSCGSVLPNLVTLLNVGSQSCTEEVLKAIPNLEKLRIQIEVAPGDAPSFHHLNHISDSLNKLKSFKCVVVNPEVGFEVVVPPPPVSMFTSSLEKLSLSGLGYPWEYMNIIGKLENLQVLKLQCYAFQGDKWETGDDAFPKLTHLMIEDTDLVCWKATVYSFSKLRHLSIKHCYNLEELPDHLVNNETIEVVDCNPFATKWANLMKARNGYNLAPGTTDNVLEILVESSWDDGRPRQYERKTPSETTFAQYIRSMIDRRGSEC